MLILRLILGGPFGRVAGLLVACLAIWAGGYVQGQQAARRHILAEEHAALIEQARRVESTLAEAADRTARRLHEFETLQSELKSYETSLDGACRLSVDDAERLRDF